MSTEYRFIEPLDVLFLRGNQLFGDPGSYGESLIPPWPSVAAGAIRSRMLADKKIDLPAFARGEVNDAELGTPAKPGEFTLAGFYLARQKNGSIDILVAPPADLIISKNKNNQLEIRMLAPKTANTALLSSFPLLQLPVLAQSDRGKAESGYWLTQAGWQKYLNGKLPAVSDLIESKELWSFDARVGIGMSSETRSVEEGKLFSMQAIAMKEGVGFLAAVSGAEPPKDGVLRLGGDGRAASLSRAEMALPEPDYATITQSRKLKIVLTTPGLFAEGWRPSLPGIEATLVSACVPRAETVSGWDLAHQKPKSAQRVAPVGSVYWFELGANTTEAQLRKLAESGLWSEPCEDAARRAEGFNRITIGEWK